MHEAWRASFTCVNSSPGYLYLVPDYASKCYSDVWKWFINTRGLPKIIILDNSS